MKTKHMNSLNLYEPKLKSHRSNDYNFNIRDSSKQYKMSDVVSAIEDVGNSFISG